MGNNMLNDLISRQAAIDALNKCYADIELDNDRPVNRYEGMFYTALKMAFERLPSAQPETAKRIVGKSKNGMTLWYQCDMCNEPVDA